MRLTTTAFTPTSGWVPPTLPVVCTNGGEGSVGRVFDTQVTERFLEFNESNDPFTVADFARTNVRSMLCVPFSGGDVTIGYDPLCQLALRCCA